MDWNELQNRIQAGENLHTEFKREIDSPNDIAAEIAAFANTDGGQICIGIADDGEIIGIADPDVVAKRIDDISYNNCEPPVTIIQEVLTNERALKVLIICGSPQKEISGRLLQIYEDSVRFLRIHLPTAHKIEGFGPEEYPEVALREAVVNAIAHRDYTVQAPIRLFVFDDRIEIRTPGRLPNTVAIPAIKPGAAHVLRNPTVYTLLSRLGLVTGVGSGIFRIIALVQKATGHEPELIEEGTEFVLRIPRRSGPPRPASL